MREIPQGGIIGKTVALVRAVSGLRVGLYASHASFFIVLSLFPSLVLLLGLLRHTGLEVSVLVTFLEGFIPEALMPAAKNIVLSTYQGTPGTVLSLSALTALWSASRGIYGLLTGLNSIYEVTEDRGWLYTRSVSVLYTFAFLIVLLLTLVVNVFGSTLLEALPWDGAFLQFLTDVVDLRFFLLLLLQTGLFTAMFMALPNRRNGFRDSVPGALLASTGWLVFSDLYSIYVKHFSGYANLYGSVYAVALSMLWLYCCICIVFYGGVLNRFLIKHRRTP